MRNRCRGLMFGLMVAASVLATSQAQGPKGSGKEVVDLARESEKGADVTAKAVALRNRFGNIRAAMRLYNPRPMGGIGTGSRGIGIERKLEELGEKAPS